MIVLGLLILVVVAAVAVGVIVRGGQNVSIDLGSFTVNTDAAGMFITGAVTLLLALIGLWLLRRGLSRSRQRRQEMRELRDRAARNDDAARRERAATQDHATDDPDATQVDDTGRHVDTDEHFDSAPRDR